MSKRQRDASRSGITHLNKVQKTQHESSSQAEERGDRSLEKLATHSIDRTVELQESQNRLDSMSQYLLKDSDISLEEVLERNSSDSFFGGNVPRNILLKIMRGLLKLLDELNGANMLIEGLLHAKNIRYSVGKFDRPKIHSYAGVSTNDRSIHYKQLKIVVEEIAQRFQQQGNEELQHFLVVLTDVIIDPNNSLNKVVLGSHIFLYDYSERIKFIKDFSDNTQMSCFSMFVIPLNCKRFSPDFRNHRYLVRYSRNPIKNKLYETYWIKNTVGPDKYDDNVLHYFRYMRNVYCHHENSKCTRRAVYDYLEDVVPGSIVSLFRKLYRIGTLHKFVL